MKASRSRYGIIPTGRVVSVLLGGRGDGAAGSKWSSARPEARPGEGRGNSAAKYVLVSGTHAAVALLGA
jgi:hypothetical protein